MTDIYGATDFSGPLLWISASSIGNSASFFAQPTSNQQDFALFEPKPRLGRRHVSRFKTPLGRIYQ